jgi:hypothetical protein
MTAPDPAPPPARSPSALAGPVLAVRFVSELVLVGGAAWAASTRPRAVVVAVAIGILAALAVAAVWGVAIAPGSRRRLADPFRLALEIALFAVVALALAAVGHVAAAVVLAVAGSATAVAVRFVEPGGRTDVPSPSADETPAGDPPADPPLRRPRGARRAHRRG